MPITLIVCYFLGINIVAFFLFGLDKYKSIRKLWRIPEKYLLLTAFFGGALGAMLGMKIFHHKTRHWKFIIGIPLLLILQCGVVLYLYLR